VRFELGAPGGPAVPFFAAPYPSEHRRGADGRLDVSGFPNPAGNAIVERLKDGLSRSASGVSLHAGAWFTFDGPLATTTLPAPERGGAASRDGDVFWVDIDPTSPARHQRVPVRVSFKSAAETYSPPNLLVVLPEPGIVLRPSTMYAVVVLDGVRDAQLRPLGSPLAMEVLKGGGTPAHGERLVAPFGWLWQHLAHAKIPRQRVRAATVFRTGDPRAQTLALRERVSRLPPPDAQAAAASLGELADHETYCALAGRVALPVLQRGARPYDELGGEIPPEAAQLDLPHAPEFQETVRFSLTLPKITAPPAGFPVVLYSAGQGGSYTQVLDRSTHDEEQRGVLGHGPAHVLAAAGFATMSLEAPLVGPRHPTGDTSGLQFFNPVNPIAFRDNTRQAALDLVTLARLLPVLRVPAGLCGRSAEVGFDATHRYLFGHSTGATVGAVTQGILPELRGVVLSGVGASWLYNLTLKFEPLPFAELTALLLGFTPGDAADLFDPVLQLAQTYWDPIEPMHWLAQATAPVLLIGGHVDGYFPPPSQRALALASGATVVPPIVDPDLAQSLAWCGDAASGPPCAMPTRLLAQFLAPNGLSGHYVPFELPAAKRAYRCFFSSLREGDVPRVPAPRGSPSDGCE
jgi:hypothetical protein